jgi:ribonuclease E
MWSGQENDRMVDPNTDNTNTTGSTGTTESAAPAPGATETGPDKPAKRARAPRKKAIAAESTATVESGSDEQVAKKTAAKKTAAKRTRTKATAAVEDSDAAARAVLDDAPLPALRTQAEEHSGVGAVVFQPPVADPAKRTRKRTPAKSAAAKADAEPAATTSKPSQPAADAGDGNGAPAGTSADTADGGTGTGGPKRRRRGRRGRGGGGGGAAAAEGGSDSDDVTATGADGAAAATDRPDRADRADGAGSDGDEPSDDESGADGTGTRKRRRRRRRRTGDGGEDGAESGTEAEDGVETVVHVREPKKRAPAKAAAGDGVRGLQGSTRLEAKRQRRKDGRDTGRRRPPIITESEFLARRESVDRVMVVRQTEERTQIAVLEDGILVEHYVARKDQLSMVGNVYLGKVQNVLPSMEAAFVDIGRGRNAVLYAGEVNYDASALEGRPPRIEQALKSGQSVLVQVTKDPIGHKGSRLTSQVSLPGRYMVYVPDGRLSGISRKLPDSERNRLKTILKRLTPADAGVIIRTAAEGATEEDLERDLRRLHAQWEDIEKKAQTASAPSAIYTEPDVVIRVIRDIFNEDFKELVVQGDDEWDTVDNYVRWVAPDLAERTRKWTDDEDVFAAYRVDEQLAKALDRKVWLPSGGYLVIDRTEAMIVVDVNTGKFTGKGGNLEETVTKNNIEAAEEIVRQLRLRDLGGIIVIDFIDMVLESNRDLVLRRLMECLGRDRTRHQVAEVTSLGLVQMTRKRVGQGLLEAFSDVCKECNGSGVVLTHDPVVSKRPPKPSRRSRGGRGKGADPTSEAVAVEVAGVEGVDGAGAAAPAENGDTTTAEAEAAVETPDAVVAEPDTVVTGAG